MSLRTLLVGVFAALCGITATVGVNMIRSQPTNAKSTIVVARIDVKPGVKITPDMISEIEWPGTTVPTGAFATLAEVTGQYTTDSFVKNEPMIGSKISPQPTFLKIPDGMRAVAIQTKTESSMVGGLIAPGNRVDLIWTVTERNSYLDGPITLTLLENVEVLAVGKSTDMNPSDFDPNRATPSITILVTAPMAEEINLAEEMGILNFTLRSTSETTDLEPRTKTSLQALLDSSGPKQTEQQKAAELKSLEKEVLSLQTLMQSQTKKISQYEDSLSEKNAEKPVLQRVDVPAGMRAVSIETPDDSTGVAGLIQPGNRVDVLLTTNLFRQSINSRLSAQAITLIENVTVAAVGTNSVTDDSPEPKLAKSITLFVTPEMARDINLGSEIGTLRLALRGVDNNDESGPRRMIVLEDEIDNAIARAEEALNPPEPEVEPAFTETALPVTPRKNQTMIRINRGGVNRDIPIDHPTQEEGRLTVR